MVKRLGGRPSAAADVHPLLAVTRHRQRRLDPKLIAWPGAIPEDAVTDTMLLKAGLFTVLLPAAAIAGSAAPAANRPVVRVWVQREAATAIDRSMADEIVRNAREIWRPYADILFEFDRDRPIPSRALRLVITERTRPLSAASLGWIEFVDGRPSDLITVSSTAATNLMKASSWNGMPGPMQRFFLAKAMGQAVAHELGHYLLASPEHAAQGLMRGQLTASDVMQPRRSANRLDAGQVQRLERGVLLAQAATQNSEF